MIGGQAERKQTVRPYGHKKWNELDNETTAK